jgi:predicted nucleic acid-binding protein
VREEWIRVGTAQDSGLLRVLSLHLHRGEAEAIALASDLSAGVVLMDEQEGRELASRAGFTVTGVLGVLLRAKHAREIRAIKPEIERLRTEARFFVSRRLESEILAAAGE